MTNLRYSDSANVDFIAALRVIRQFFDEKESPELGEKHIELFSAELKRKEKILIDNPQLYPLRREYKSSHTGRQYRTFNAHWFIVFYTYEESEGVIIWFIRSSVSDYSSLIMLS
jgi:plasmid stabilization system protein ParE